MTDRPRVLIVDDDALDRQAVVRALRREAAAPDGVGADVREVSTLEAARQALRREEFACVFLDHHLPDGTSLDLLAELRSEGAATPVVVLTGQGDERTVVEVMRAGAADYLPKDGLRPDLVARSLRSAVRLGRAQRERRAALEELHTRDRAIAAATNGIVIADARRPDLPLVYVNDAFLRLTGYREEEVLGRNCRFLQGAGTDPEAVRALGRAIREARACQALLLNYRRDGTTFWNEVTVSPVRDDAGRLTHFVGVQTDVTERQAAHEERRRAADELRRFQLLVENAGDALLLLDGEGRVLYANAAACRSLGYGPDEVRGLRAHDIDPDCDDAAYRALFQRLGGGRLPPFEALRRRRDGTTFPVEVSATRLDVGGRPLVFASARDISERRRAEEERRAVEAERAQIAEREHRIAEHLQSALQPALPGAVSGLAVTKYYEAALAEQARVGGDFYDVFAVEKGCTALVVGDLSGKGLAAAAAVATVRNMLRAFLYARGTVAEAVTELNRVLAENGLLAGFATLFVGAYDSGTRGLNYVNCGQEPGLLRRAAGAVEHLAPTGPILGQIEDARYVERGVTLAPGDALAVFTDGLTEVGPRRTEMLGVEGVAALLAAPVAPGQPRGGAEMAEHLALRLIAGVDAAAAGGVTRDDVCLLVAVVE